MENARQQLCKDQNFDPITAFKLLDSFKHNKIVPFEIYSFLELNRIESTVEECEQIMIALNKSLTFMDYDNFE